MSTTTPTDWTLRIVLVIIAVVVLAPILTMTFAFPMMGMWGGGMSGGYGGMMGGYGGTGVSPLWGLASMLVWLVVLVGGGYLAYRWLSGDGGAATDPALEELRLAYARGDLSEEEYVNRRATLEEE